MGAGHRGGWRAGNAAGPAGAARRRRGDRRRREPAEAGPGPQAGCRAGAPGDRGPGRHREDPAGGVMTLDEVYASYLASHRQGRLATIGPGGSPQVKPVGYRYNRELGTIDISGYAMERSAKYRNVAT